MTAFGGTRVDDFVDGGNGAGGLDAFASALVAGAFAGESLKAQSTPERDDENVEPGHLADPLDPRKGHRPGPNEPLPVDVPPVPKLRPLE